MMCIAVKAEGFIAINMGFENTAGPYNHQAVALLVEGDQSAFFLCKISGYQDTLAVHSGRQFYRECQIGGTVDFMFGYSTAIFQRCTIVAKKRADHGHVTLIANGRFEEDSTEFSFQFCYVTADIDLLNNVNVTPTCLGRPWGKYSRTVFMQSTLGSVATPKGWLEWGGNREIDTLYYGEFMNNGPGSELARWVRWPGYHTNPSEADEFTAANFLDRDSWLPSTGILYTSELGSPIPQT